MNKHVFSVFATHLHQTAGLVLHESQVYLLEARLIPLLNRYQCENFAHLADHVTHKGNPSLLRDITEVMVTHETSFLRDSKAFSFFDEAILPFLIKKNVATKTLRFWSAGCASGQEPYSIAMLLHDRAALLKDWTIEILASDVSHDVIQRAQNGLYSHFDVQRGLPIRLLLRHFDQHDQNTWRLHDDVKSLVTFRQMNLLDNFNYLESFDMIFCRNVLIYLDRATRYDLLRRFHRTIDQDGYLMLGGVETLMGPTDYWINRDPIGCLYRPIIL